MRMNGKQTEGSSDVSTGRDRKTDYRQLVAPDLKKAAIPMPYGQWMFPAANAFQTLAFSLCRISDEVNHRILHLTGAQNRPLAVHVLEPKNRSGSLPALVYLHGGAFSFKAAAYHKKLAAQYASEAGCRVFLVDYHLAPRCPWPAAYEDSLAVWSWLHRNWKEQAVDPDRIGLAGDSAGGCLAALAANRAEQEGQRPPCLLMLVYPVTDASMSSESMKRFADTPLWNARSNQKMWDCVWPENDRKDSDLASISPMHCPLPVSFPAVYVETAEYDCLHDEGAAYVRRLRETGADVEWNDTKGTYHGYDLLSGSETAQKQIAGRIAFLRRAFHTNPSKDSGR